MPVTPPSTPSSPIANGSLGTVQLVGEKWHQMPLAPHYMSFGFQKFEQILTRRRLKFLSSYYAQNLGTLNTQVNTKLSSLVTIPQNAKYLMIQTWNSPGYVSIKFANNTTGWGMIIPDGGILTLPASYETISKIYVSMRSNQVNLAIAFFDYL